MTSYSEYHKRYYEKKKDCKEEEKAIKLKLLNNARYRATQRKIEFNLQEEDIIIPDKCPYLDVNFSEMFGKNKEIRSDFLPTIDRKNNQKGYIKGNIEVISRLANVMKNKATKDQLVSFSKKIFKDYLDEEIEEIIND